MSGADPWNPAQYGKFKQERSLPFFDLLSLVSPEPGGRTIDLGCGTGELTKLAHEATRARETIGLDSSAAMIARCREHEGGGVSFRLGDIAGFAGEYDCILSNAALHWLPDHPALIRKFHAALRPGGCLAFQVPANHNHPASLAAGEVAREEPFRTALGGWTLAYPVELPERYAELLHDLGFEKRLVMMKVYEHELEGRDDVAEWYKGTMLTAYERRLGPELFGRFYASYLDRVRQILPDRRPYLFTFNRILVRGVKS